METRILRLFGKVATKDIQKELQSIANRAEVHVAEMIVIFIGEAFRMNTKYTGHTVEWFLKSDDDELLVEVLNTSDFDKILKNMGV